MKRFWKQAVAVEGAAGWQIELDGRPVRTPARAALALPNRALAEAIRVEWAAVGESIDPRAMPLNGLANAAIDHVARDPGSFVASLTRFAHSDLLTYRAEGPRLLFERESRTWDPLLAWARRRFDVDFVIATGINPVAQPAATVARLEAAVAVLDPFTLAGLAPLVTIGGSLVTGLALLEQAVDVATGWAAVSLDEQYQLDTWGEDTEARKALDQRQADYRAGARFLELLRG